MIFILKLQKRKFFMVPSILNSNRSPQLNPDDNALDPQKPNLDLLIKKSLTSLALFEKSNDLSQHEFEQVNESTINFKQLLESMSTEDLSKINNVISVINKLGSSLSSDLSNAVDSSILEIHKEQKICLDLAETGIEKALEKARRLTNDSLRNETIKNICLLHARNDINSSLKLINEQLTPESFHYFDAHKKLIKMLIENLEEGHEESDIAEVVTNFINESVNQALKIDSSIDSVKRTEILLKDACDVLVTFNSKIAQIVASKITSDFKRSSALMEVIRDMINKNDISGAIETAEADHNIRNILLKFICECMDKRKMDRNEINRVVDLISSDSMKSRLTSDLWFGL